MNAKTLQALKASILKWDRNAKAEMPYDYRIGMCECPLCNMFHPKLTDGDLDEDCDGCPVKAETGHGFCKGTPFDAAYDAHFRWEIGEGTRAAAWAAARKEADFLRNLLPEGEEC